MAAQTIVMMISIALIARVVDTRFEETVSIQKLIRFRHIEHRRIDPRSCRTEDSSGAYLPSDLDQNIKSV